VTRGVIQNFHDVLGDQDWLVVGHAEPNGESFCCFRAVYRPGVTLYQKSATRIIVSTNAPAPLAKAPLWAGGAMPLIATQLPARHINGGAAVAMVRSDTPAHQESRIPLSELARLRLLANSGDVESTLLCCQELLEKDRCNPLIYFYRAMALEILGAYEEAEGSLRQVIYLDRRFILAHYQLGLIRQRARNDRQAVQAFTNLLRLLSGIPDEQTLAETEGMTAAELKRLAQAHLKILDGSLKKIWTAD
jgi:chemotaxis protein methyltransferase CheR